jgi:hypothetical protein
MKREKKKEEFPWKKALVIAVAVVFVLMFVFSYLMTAGRPIDAVTDVFRNLYRDVGDKAKIAGVGVTGSGRYLVGSFIGADLIKNEITAQTRAAAELDPEADIIEIGGQDSKLVIKRHGVVVDYQMNKACAAGTGSFIDELAEQCRIIRHHGESSWYVFARLGWQNRSSAPQSLRRLLPVPVDIHENIRDLVFTLI